MIGLPVVTCKWLLECYNLEKRVPLKNHLLGKSKSPADDVIYEQVTETHRDLLHSEPLDKTAPLKRQAKTKSTEKSRGEPNDQPSDTVNPKENSKLYQKHTYYITSNTLYNNYLFIFHRQFRIDE